MSSLRTPANSTGSDLFNELATFAARYMRNPENSKQYNSTQKRTLFEENFMTEDEFVTEFAKLERTVGPNWPLNEFHSDSTRPYFTGTLSEKICSYVISSLYPSKNCLKCSAAANDDPWYLFFNHRFEDFNFLDYTPSAGEKPLKKLDEYLSNKRIEINTLTKLRNLKQCLFDKPQLAVETVEALQKKCTGLKDKLDSIEQVAPGPELLPERVLVQKLIYYLSSLPADRLPAIRKSEYSIIGFYHREQWRQELGKVYYMSPGAGIGKNTLFF